MNIEKAIYFEREFSQRQIISLLFFVLRDNCHYINEEERKHLKNLVKAAQRQLVFIRQGDAGYFLGCQTSTIKHFKELFDKVMISRNMAYRWFGTCTITPEQQKLLHTNRQAIGRSIRNQTL